MSVVLFDEPYYIRINEARWAVAKQLLVGIQDQCEVQLKTCLDVGSGPGWFTQRLATLGLAVEGLEGRVENVQAAQARLPQVPFYHVNVESEQEVATFKPCDLTFCFGLLYHTENPFRVLRNLRRLTKKVLLIESMLIPSESPCAWLIGENVNETQGLTSYAMIPSRTSLIKMLESAGFPYRYEYQGPVEHEDFQETEARYRRRGIFVASSMALSLNQLYLLPAIAIPKYDFTKRNPVEP